MDIIDIDYKTFANAYKRICKVLQAIGYQALHLRQIHTHRDFHLVYQDNGGIIAISFHIDNLGAVYAMQLIASIDVKVFC